MVRRAMLVESSCQFLCYLLRHPVLNLTALHHVNKLAVFQDGYGRRGWRIACEVAACAFRCFNVASGEDGRNFVWTGFMFEGKGDARTRFASRAAADRVDDDHQCAFG